MKITVNVRDFRWNYPIHKTKEFGLQKLMLKVALNRNENFAIKVMMWLAVYSKGVSPMVIFENRRIDDHRYICEVLPVALQYGKDLLAQTL